MNNAASWGAKKQWAAGTYDGCYSIDLNSIPSDAECAKEEDNVRIFNHVIDSPNKYRLSQSQAQQICARCAVKDCAERLE